MNLDPSDIKKIIAIQRRFKLNRIQKHLKGFDLMKLDESFSQLDYTKTMMRLMNRELPRNVNILMLRINRYLNPEKRTVSKIMGKLFLTMYLLKYHSAEVMVTIDLQDRTILKYQGINIINFLNDLFMKSDDYRTFSIHRFGSMFNVYCIRYNQLQAIDKVNMINEPYRHYANIKTTIRYVQNCAKYPDDQKQDIIKVLEEEIEKTFQCIKMLDRDFDVKKFDEISGLEEEIRNSFTDSYWDKLKQDLESENFEELLKLLTKLKNILLDLHPKAEEFEKYGGNIKPKVVYRETVRQNFDEYVDNEFIQHLLERRVMSNDQIIGLCTYLMDTVVALQASARDTDTKVSWKQMIETFEAGETTVAEFIPNFFKQIFDVIDKICSDILLIPILQSTAKWSFGNPDDKCK